MNASLDFDALYRHAHAGDLEAQFQLGRVWRKHFGRRYPAMGLFGVTALAEPGAMVELMGVAVVGQ